MTKSCARLAALVLKKVSLSVFIVFSHASSAYQSRPYTELMSVLNILVKLNPYADMKLSQFDLISTPTGNETTFINHGKVMYSKSQTHMVNFLRFSFF
jgi:hypothetical protein